MTPRIDIYKYIGTNSGKALLALAKAVKETPLDHGLLELVALRTSQINGCAHCIDMHTKDARAGGETEQRLYALSAWRETPFYTERERAALEWAEAQARIADTHVPDDVYERVRQQFDEHELVLLTFAAITTNAFNRLAVSFRVVPGAYQPPNEA